MILFFMALTFTALAVGIFKLFNFCAVVAIEEPATYIKLGHGLTSASANQYFSFAMRVKESENIRLKNAANSLINTTIIYFVSLAAFIFTCILVGN
jgi:hypothetical protein